MRPLGKGGTLPEAATGKGFVEEGIPTGEEFCISLSMHLANRQESWPTGKDRLTGFEIGSISNFVSTIFIPKVRISRMNRNWLIVYGNIHLWADVLRR